MLRNALAVLLVLCCAPWTPPGLAAEAKDLSTVNDLDRQVVELYQSGKYQEAIPFARQLLGLREEINGPEHPATAISLNNLAELYREIGDFLKAESLYRRALAIREKALGPEHPKTATSLGNLAALYYSSGDYTKAEPILRRTLAIREKALGPEHPDTATTLNNLALLCYSMGEYAKADSLLRRSLAICEKALGPEHPDTATSLGNMAGLYASMGEYTKAASLYRRALVINEKTLGPEHLSTATTLNNLAELCKKMGEYTKAEPILQRALAISERTLGPEHPATATNLNNLAGLYVSMGDYFRAEPLYQSALAIKEKTFGPDHPSTATSLNNLAELYREVGDYAKGAPLYTRALTIREKALGPEHPDTATSINNLALSYYSMGDYAKAELLYQRALAICEKAFGPEHPDTAANLNNLAGLYHAMGDYGKAEPLHQRALAIREKALDPEHPDSALSLDSLARLYDSKGDYIKAERLYRRALAIREKALGSEHPDSAYSLDNLAGLYDSIGDYASAERFYRRALTIREKTLGPKHPNTATSLNNLAMLYGETGDYPRAEALFQRALAIREKALGPKHPDTATSLNTLAWLCGITGDSAKAEALFQRALAIREEVRGPEHPDTATSLTNLAVLYSSMGDYKKAEPLYRRALAISEKVFGPEHPDTAVSLHNLATLNINLGRAGRALEFGVRARKADEAQLGEVLAFTCEQQRLAFQDTTSPCSLLATLGSAPDIAQAILRSKGVVLDSLLEDRLVAEASENVTQRALIDQLRTAKQRYTQSLMERPKDFSAESHQRREADLEKQAAQVEQLEATLARQVSDLGRARRALSVAVAAVQGALAADQVLVELLRYSHYMGRNKWEPHYGALVIASRGEPKWIPLGSAAEIETSIQLFRKSVRGDTDESTLHSVLRSLHDQVWAPIEKGLPANSKTIILSPDGELSFVSFATLLAPADEFLIENYSIRYVASGRDLLRGHETSATELMAVFGNPDFGSGTNSIVQQKEMSSPLAIRASESRDFGDMSLKALPATDKECAGLKAQAKTSGRPIQVLLGAEATETQLREIASPHILHLATHGFFLPETKDRRGEEERALETGRMNLIGETYKDQRTPVVLKNPMHRSGLALAGAQRTLEAWAKGEVPPTDNDGIVTAEEVGELNLKGTWLVVLSACDTGTGEARAGEGVLGLRRGFIQAGARNLLMTLWPISDETTVDIMLDFYGRALVSGNAAQSLLDAQHEWLVRLRKEKGLLYAVNRAGPFILSSQGAGR